MGISASFGIYQPDGALPIRLSFAEVRVLPGDEILISAELSPVANKPRLLLFFALAYLISWLIWLPLIASSQNWTAVSPPFVLYFLGTIGPAVAAVLMTGLDSGRQGVWALLRRLVLWRVASKWYLTALLLPVVVRSAALGALYFFGRFALDLSLSPWHELVWLFGLMLILVPLEEIGWRGYALPRLQISHSPFWASMIVGVMWSFWHLPLMWISGSYQETRSPLSYMLVFTLTLLPTSVLFTWLYNQTRGSLLLVSLFHASINVTESALIIREEDGLLLLLTACALNSALAALVTSRLVRPSRR